MNDVVYQIACFMIMREPTVWRWSHTRHHTDTIIVGRDPEIAVPRPPDLCRLLLNFFGISKSGYALIRRSSAMPSARLTAEEETFIPEMERPKVYPRRAHLARDLRRDDRRLRSRLRLDPAG